jgi:hypothetical protein
MRIATAGNVGIGTSSNLSSTRLDVRSVNIADGTDVSQIGAYSTTAQAANVGGRINLGGLYDANTTISFAGIAGRKENSTSGDWSGYLQFSTRKFGGDFAERMRINSDGFATVTGSFGRGAPVTKTGNFTLAATENWIICNGSGSITVTLPAASSWTGRELTIKTIAAQTVVSASSNVVPLNSGTAGTAILSANAGRWATLVSDGTNWVIMAGVV